jgi:hypothetical protein|tara:strand:- start:9 stop:284 length:276 start_codon:yes stop_codon:yes gene_type:complete
MTAKTIKGTVGEYKAIIKLMEDGYHLAKAVDQHCPFDIVAVNKNGDVKLIDVKTIAMRKKFKPTWSIKSKQINRVLTEVQKKMGVQLMFLK